MFIIPTYTHELCTLETSETKTPLIDVRNAGDDCAFELLLFRVYRSAVRLCFEPSAEIESYRFPITANLWTDTHPRYGEITLARKSRPERKRTPGGGFISENVSAAAADRTAPVVHGPFFRTSQLSRVRCTRTAPVPRGRVQSERAKRIFGFGRRRRSGGEGGFSSTGFSTSGKMSGALRVCHAT